MTSQRLSGDEPTPKSGDDGVRADLLRELDAAAADPALLKPCRIRHYRDGHVLEVEITGVYPLAEGRVINDE